MEFFIKKNATLPLLKMQIVKDGESSLENFSEIIENSLIYFSAITNIWSKVKLICLYFPFIQKL